MSEVKLAVYTAIFGGKDIYKEPDCTDFDAYVFTDIALSPRRARAIQLPRLVRDDPRRSARLLKALPELILRDYEMTLWVDGSARFKQFGIGDLLRYVEHKEIATFSHRERGNPFDEGDECIKLGLDDPETIRRQLERYKLEGFRGAGALAETRAVLRRKSPRVENFNRIWWSEILHGSRRDQLSFNYAAWKAGLDVSYFEGDVNESPFFHFEDHAY
jgi:hypothetical protein